MSANDDSDPSPLMEVYRTVTPYHRGGPNTEMSAIGWVIFGILLVLLIPLLPFILLWWVLEAVRGRIPKE